MCNLFKRSCTIGKPILVYCQQSCQFYRACFGKTGRHDHNMVDWAVKPQLSQSGDFCHDRCETGLLGVIVTFVKTGTTPSFSELMSFPFCQIHRFHRRLYLNVQTFKKVKLNISHLFQQYFNHKISPPAGLEPATPVKLSIITSVINIFNSS